MMGPAGDRGAFLNRAMGAVPLIINNRPKSGAHSECGRIADANGEGDYARVTRLQPAYCGRVVGVDFVVPAIDVDDHQLSFFGRVNQCAYFFIVDGLALGCDVIARTD